MGARVDGPVGERHSGYAAAGRVDRGDLGVGLDRRAGCAGARGDRLGDSAHAADHLAPGSDVPVELAERVVEKVVSGARGVGAGPDADDAGRGDRALEVVVLEERVEHVADGHREDPDQLLDVALGHAGDAPGLLEDARDVDRSLRAQRGGLADHHRPHEVGGHEEEVLELLVAGGVLLRELGDRLAGLADVVVEDDRAVGSHRGVGGVEGVRLVAVALQLEVVDDLRLEHRDDVGGARDAGAWPDLFGHARAAEDVATLEDERPEAGASEVGTGSQAVVPAADHDRVPIRLRMVAVGRCGGRHGSLCSHSGRLALRTIDYKINSAVTFCV